jgi:MFS family permease
VHRARETRVVDRFVLLYALAWAGGAIAYTPLLTILLPARVMQLAGPQLGIGWLAYIALFGAGAASVGAILFGYLSDITRHRRIWILCGLILSCVLLNVLGKVSSLPSILVVIVFWQLALNMMLAPLAAWAADHVPDHRKGRLGGFMAFAPALGGLSGAFVTHPGLADGAERLLLLAMIVTLCILPVLVVAGRRPDRRLDQQKAPEERSPIDLRSMALRMWIARFAVQITEATMFAYLFHWLRSLDARTTDNQTAWLFSAVLLVSAPLALIVGNWSDRRESPIRPLAICAMIAALGLVGMMLARHNSEAALGYGVFGVSSALFLALHSAQTMRILPRSDRRGRDLGLFNLTNTTPSLVMPWIAMALIPTIGFQGLFALLAFLAAFAGLILFSVAKSIESPA